MSDQLYANGRIAVLSTKLFGMDKFSRLAECSTLAEALRVLVESGYGNGVTVTNPNDYEQLLSAELDGVMTALKELCCDANVLKYLLCKYDYLNAKTLMKRKYMRVDGVENCFTQASFEPQQMQQAFVNDDYSQFSANMAKACDTIDTQFANGNRSPQVVDMYLDKAMYADMFAYAKKCSLALVRKLLDWQVNTTNLMLIYRLRKAGYSAEQFADWIIDGGSIKKNTLLKLWDNDSVALDLPEEYRRFYALCKQEVATLVAAEREQRFYRNKLVVDNADVMTAQPAVDYFYKKVDETEKVRYALIGVKNGVDKEKIKDQLK